MWNKPAQQQLNAIPPLYSTEETPLKEKMIHMHFFLVEATGTPVNIQTACFSAS